MGKGKFTTEQWAAINTRGSDLLVAAAAGSGKTAVLVERIIKRITEDKNPVDIDRLLVVTFTSAAAAEMRERIALAIENRLQENPESEWLQRQMTLLGRAKITTIHSFCLEVIRENYQSIDIDPSFRIGDEGEMSLLKSELLEDYFEELYSEENNQEFLALVESYGENTKDLRLREHILNIHAFVQSSPFPEQWIDEMTKRYHLLEEDKLEDTFFGKCLMQELHFELRGLLELSMKALHTVEEYHVFEYEAAIKNDIEQLQELIEKAQSGFERVYAALFSFKPQALGRRKKDSDQSGIEIIKMLRDNVKKGISDLQDKIFLKPPNEMKQDIQRLYPVVVGLGNLVKGFSKRFQTAKKERLLVDFNDLEHYCLEALLAEGSSITNAVPSQAAKLLQLKFEEVLTDEYQDSNLVQEMILSVVSRSSAGNHNRFMVGDVKQSIYRFRLAKPELFMEKYHTYSSEEGSEKRKIDLFQNFRSRENVLYGINFLFRQLMSHDLGEVEYDDKAALYPGAVFPKPEEGIKCAGKLELHLIDFTTASEQEISLEDESGEMLEEITNMELEATYVVNKVKEMTESGYCVLDKETRDYRKICYSDIVVLLRAPGGLGALFVEKFTTVGIPSFADTGTGYFDTIEVLTMLNLLRLIDNKRQDIPMLSVLKSPIYRISSEELLEIRTSEKNGSFFECVDSYLKNGTSESLQKKLFSFLEQLENWRRIALYTPIDELIWMLYEQTGYFDYVGAASGGNIRQANLRLLMDRAEQYEKTSFKGLFHFIQYIEKLQKNKNQSGSAKILGENENLVRIMSIHKSKGLEFPVVFVSGLGKKFNSQDVTKPILLHQDMGFGTVFVDFNNRVTYNTIARAALARRISNENLSEEMRILYVAFTRAKEKLILTGGVKNIDKALSRWTMFLNEKNVQLPHYSMLKANTYLDWIIPAVSRHKDGRILREEAEVDIYEFGNGLFDDKSQWDVDIVYRKSILLGKKMEEETAKCAQFALENWDVKKDYSPQKEQIMKRLGWHYEYEQSVKLPANLSISELKRHFQQENLLESTIQSNYEDSLSMPAFLKPGRKLTAAERGTALHTLMERLDFSRNYTKEELEKELETLKRLRILTEQEAKTVAICSVMDFLCSTLGERLRASGQIQKEKTFAISISPQYAYAGLEYEGLEESILIHGMIDCFFYEGEDIVLLDYKTDAITDEVILQNRYALQMGYYKKALEQITKSRVKEAYLYSFAIGKEIKMEL